MLLCGCCGKRLKRLGSFCTVPGWVNPHRPDGFKPAGPPHLRFIDPSCLSPHFFPLFSLYILPSSLCSAATAHKQSHRCIMPQSIYSVIIMKSEEERCVCFFLFPSIQFRVAESLHCCFIWSDEMFKPLTTSMDEAVGCEKWSKPSPPLVSNRSM